MKNARNFRLTLLTQPYWEYKTNDWLEKELKNSEQQATHHATTIPSKHNFLLYAPFKHVCSDQEVNIMQIFVGQNAYQVEASTSIDTLKAMIENKEFIPAQFIRLVNGANAIEGGTLAGNGIEEDDSIAMVYDALAGMRAKWRKKRMRRLRRKRRKMRQRAR